MYCGARLILCKNLLCYTQKWDLWVMLKACQEVTVSDGAGGRLGSSYCISVQCIVAINNLLLLYCSNYLFVTCIYNKDCPAVMHTFSRLTFLPIHCQLMLFAWRTVKSCYSPVSAYCTICAVVKLTFDSPPTPSPGNARLVEF